MKKYYIPVYDDSHLNTRELCCDDIDTKYFKNTNDLDIFVRMHPSCKYVITNRYKYENYPNIIEVVFARYYHEIAKSNFKHCSIKLSYNSNPSDDNELEEYYYLKGQEESLKSALDHLKELIKKYEK